MNADSVARLLVILAGADVFVTAVLIYAANRQREVGSPGTELEFAL